MDVLNDPVEKLDYIQVSELLLCKGRWTAVPKLWRELLVQGMGFTAIWISPVIENLEKG